MSAGSPTSSSACVTRAVRSARDRPGSCTARPSATISPTVRRGDRLPNGILEHDLHARAQAPQSRRSIVARSRPSKRIAPCASCMRSSAKPHRGLAGTAFADEADRFALAHRERRRHRPRAHGRRCAAACRGGSGSARARRALRPASAHRLSAAAARRAAPPPAASACRDAAGAAKILAPRPGSRRRAVLHDADAVGVAAHDVQIVA